MLEGGQPGFRDRASRSLPLESVARPARDGARTGRTDSGVAQESDNPVLLAQAHQTLGVTPTDQDELRASSCKTARIFRSISSSCRSDILKVRRNIFGKRTGCQTRLPRGA